MEIKRTITIGSEEETRNFGLALADELAAGDVLALKEITNNRHLF